MAQSSASIPNFRYEKRTPAPATEANPTVASLMASKDKSKFVEFTMPLKAKAYNVKYDKITLNRRKFEPGKTYKVHPLIYAELMDRIEKFERAIYLQVNSANDAGIPLFSGDFANPGETVSLEELTATRA